jgi:MarR family transcriptional regulator for hemolysin
VARRVSRAFDDAMTAAGGSRSIWLVLLTVRTATGPTTQRELADRLQLRGATLTHHLSAMEARGLVERVRNDHDKRQVQVALTPDGEALFGQLRLVAVQFDAALRRGLTTKETATLHDLLGRLERNVDLDG